MLPVRTVRLIGAFFSNVSTGMQNTGCFIYLVTFVYMHVSTVVNILLQI